MEQNPEPKPTGKSANRRTLEERLAYHQERAAKARQKVAKQRRALETRLQVTIGAAMMARADGKGGALRVGELTGRTALAIIAAPALDEQGTELVAAWVNTQPKP